MSNNKTAKVFSKAWNGFSGISSWAKSGKKAGSRAHRAPDLVTPKAKRVANVARNKFGVSLPVLENVARTADPEKLRLIFAQGETGVNQQQMSPLITQAVTDKIKGVEAVQKMNADILKTAAQSAVGIKKAQNSAELTNTKYGNQITEVNMGHEYALEAEDRRHAHGKQTVILNAYVGEYMDRTNQQATLKQKVLDVQQAQIQSDRDYKAQQLALLAAQGSHANFDTIARREYDFGKPQSKMNSLPQKTPVSVTGAIKGIMNYITGK